MEISNYTKLSEYELNEINGGGIWGFAGTVALSAAGGAAEGAEYCAVLGPEGAVAGAVGFGLCCGMYSAIGYVLTSKY